MLNELFLFVCMYHCVKVERELNKYSWKRFEAFVQSSVMIGFSCRDFASWHMKHDLASESCWTVQGCEIVKKRKEHRGNTACPAFFIANLES